MDTFYPDRGWIEVICGSMFCGKTEELLRRLRRVEIAGKPFQVFKPGVDNRYDSQCVVSHNQDKREASIVENAAGIVAKLNKQTKVIAIDEAQFFDDKVVEICQNFANNGLRVIIAGLDQDYLGKPFGSMPHLMAIAEEVVKLHAICKKCGMLASKSKRLKKSDRQVEIGHSDIYEARCRKCFALE